MNLVGREAPVFIAEVRHALAWTEAVVETKLDIFRGRAHVALIFMPLAPDQTLEDVATREID